MAQYLRPDSSVAKQWWSRDRWQDIAVVTPNDRRYARSRPGKVGAFWVLGLTAPVDPPADGLSTIRVRLGRSRNGFAFNREGQEPRYQLRLYEGDTLFAQDSVRVASQLPNQNWLESLFSGLRPRFETISWVVNTSGIVDWSDLRVEIEVVGFDTPDGRSTGLAVSWLEMAAPDDEEAVPDENILTGVPRVTAALMLTGDAMTEERLLFSGDEQDTGSDALMLSGDQQGGDDYLLLDASDEVSLTGDDITAFVHVSPGILWLVPDSIVTGAPLIDTAAADDGTLNGAGVTTGVPVLDEGLLGSLHALTGDEIVVAPALDEGVLSQTHSLIGDPIDVGEPDVGTAVAKELHPLLGDPIDATASVLDEGVLQELHVLLGDDITTDPVEVGQGAVSQLHVLLGDEIITSAPTLDSAILREVHAFHGDTFVITVLIDEGVLEQNHKFLGDDIETGRPTVEAALFGQNHRFTGYDIVVQPITIDKIALEQVHAIAGDDIVTEAPVLEAGMVTFRWILLGDDIVTGRTLIDQGVLTQEHYFLGDPVQGRRPRLDRGFVEPPPDAPREVVCAGTGPREVFRGYEPREVVCTGLRAREVAPGCEMTS